MILRSSSQLLVLDMRRSASPHLRSIGSFGVVSTLMLVWSAAMGAQAPALERAAPAASFSLADAAAQARRQHPLLMAAGGRRQMATGAARQEGALPNPVFEWRKENYGSPLPRDEFISAGMPVDLYGRRMALRAAGGFAATRALSDSATLARQVEFDVARAYWRTALAEALRAAAAQQRAAFDTIARIEQERATQGAVPVGSAVRARLEADRARLAESAARAELDRARGDLARAMAMPFDSVPQPTDTLGIAAVESVPALEALLPIARAQRSELRAAQSRLDESMRRQLAERLGTLPAVGVQAGSKRTSGYKTGTLQIGVAVPFFDRNGGNRQRAHGEVLVAGGELREAQAAIAAEVTAAWRAYRTLLSEYDRSTSGDLRDLETRGGTMATIAATAYREGAIPLFELLDTQRVRSEVRVAALRASADLRLARLDLLRALGLPVESPRFLLPTP
jgi:cobalt-zinc-cadmium efflux system outer membrane protein